MQIYKVRAFILEQSMQRGDQDVGLISKHYLPVFLVLDVDRTVRSYYHRVGWWLNYACRLDWWWRVDCRICSSWSVRWCFTNRERLSRIASNWLFPPKYLELKMARTVFRSINTGLLYEWALKWGSLFPFVKILQGVFRFGPDQPKPQNC